MPTPTKTSDLYKGKIIIDFFENTHAYLKRGDKKRLISVTACTGMIDKSRPLMIWQERLTRDHLISLLKNGLKILEEHIVEATSLHRTKKEEAASLGSQVHSWAESYINHQLKLSKEKPEIPANADPRVINGIMAFLKWVDEEKPKFLWTEKLVYSKKHDYVGLMDLAFTLKREGHKIIHAGDIKTSSGIYNEYRYQVSAYQEADAEESGRVYGTKWLMRFDKETGEFEAHEYAEHDKDFQTFLACLTIKKREKELSKW